jgi:predicted methyltransferase
VRFALALSLASWLAACDRGRPPPAAARAPSAAGAAAYDQLRQPELLIARLGLRPGERVADVGAGRGYLTWRLARAVAPGGSVLATDIDPGALAAIESAKVPEPERARVQVRRVRASDPGLEPGAYDLVLLSDVDQYLPDRVDYLRRLAPALAPGGRIAVVNRRTYRAPLLAAAAASGLRAREVDFTATHFLAFLEVPR